MGNSLVEQDVKLRPHFRREIRTRLWNWRSRSEHEHQHALTHAHTHRQVHLSLQVVAYN